MPLSLCPTQKGNSRPCVRRQAPGCIPAVIHTQTDIAIPITHPEEEKKKRKKRDMKVKIKTWNAVASWRWDVPEDDVCGICRVQFDGTCPNCRFPGDDCPLRMALPSLPVLLYSAPPLTLTVVGKCGHSFHMVSRFLGT